MDKRNELTASGYQFGSCQRKRFRGYSLYNYFELSEFSLTDRHGKFFFTDHWFEYLQSQNHLAGYPKDSYEEDMKKYFRENPELWDLSNEKLYERIKGKRSLLLSGKITRNKLEQTVHQEKMRILLGGSRVPGCKIWDNCFVEYGINQQAFLEHFLYLKKTVIVTVCDMRWVPMAIQKAKELLYNGKEVFFLLKEKSDDSVFTAEEWKEEEFANAYFSDFWTRTKRPKLLFCHADCFGMRFDRVFIPRELSKAIQRKEVLLLGFGEDILLSVHDLSVPSVIYSKSESVYAKSILNIYDANAVSIVYIPERFNIFQYVSVVEAPEITYAQYAKISERYGLGIYQEEPEKLKKLFPGYFMNMFSDRLESDVRSMGLLEVQGAETENGGIRKADELYKTLALRKRTAELWMDKGEKYTSFIKLHGFSQDASSDYTLINGLIADSSQKAEVMVIQDYKKMSFRTYMRISRKLESPRYICNFLFYFTPKLMEQYNKIRKYRPQEQLQAGNFYLDYYQERRNSENHQTFPLFNKACIAKNQNGEIRFFHYQLGGGSVYFLDSLLKWRQEDVNPQRYDGHREIIVYTPMISMQDEGKSSSDYVKTVGKNRLNLLVVGESIVCIRQGDLLMPSVGVVISLDGLVRKHMEKQLRFPLNAEGYYECGLLPIRIFPDPPKGIELSEWRNMQWTFGGGMMLIEDSRCIYDENPYNLFHREGWLTPLSAQTQESSVHDGEERHPRTMIGLCDGGKLFILVFSGRSRYIRGVTYQEACSLARQYIPDISYMMAMDGGASSFLGVLGNDSFMELSYPACNIENGTGTVRRVNSVLMV